MVNSNILFANQPAESGPSNAFNITRAVSAMKDAPYQNQLLQAQVEGQQLSNKINKNQLTKEQAIMQLGDAATDALILQPILQSGDMNRVNMFLDQRVKKIQQRGGDPVDTLDLKQRLNSGATTPEQAQAELMGIVNAATQHGIIQQDNGDLRQQEIDLRRKSLEQQAAQFDRSMQMRAREMNSPRQQMTPSAVAEYEYYRSLTPDQRSQYDAMKRGTPGYSASTEKQIYGAADAYVEDNAKFEDYSDLANRYESAQGKLSSGAYGSVKEWLKEQTGNQDQFTLMRKDWAQIKASEVVRNLPPGAASDADISFALQGFLPNNANPKSISSFLRGLAKMHRLNAEYNSFKADYLSETKNPGGLLKAWKDKAKEIQLDGVTNSSSQQTNTDSQQIYDYNY